MIKETALTDFHFVEVDGDGDKYELTFPAQFFIGIFPHRNIIYKTSTLSTAGILYNDIKTRWNGADVVFDVNNKRASLPHDIPIKMSRDGLITLSFAQKIRVDFVYFRIMVEDSVKESNKRWKNIFNLARAFVHFMGVVANPWHLKKGVRGG